LQEVAPAWCWPARGLPTGSRGFPLARWLAGLPASFLACLGAPLSRERGAVLLGRVRPVSCRRQSPGQPPGWPPRGPGPLRLPASAGSAASALAPLASAGTAPVALAPASAEPASARTALAGPASAGPGVPLERLGPASAEPGVPPERLGPASAEPAVPPERLGPASAEPGAPPERLGPAGPPALAGLPLLAAHHRQAVAGQQADRQWPRSPRPHPPPAPATRRAHHDGSRAWLARRVPRSSFGAGRSP